MSNFAKDLIEGMQEAVAHADGKTAAATVHVVEVPDVRAIRRQLHMSQHEFAEAYRIPLATLKNWEQGRRAPSGAARTLLLVAAKHPKALLEVV